jgi:hypothetical protein
MADQKISELTAASTGASADLLHIVQGGANKKLTVQNFLENIAGNVKIDGYLAFDGTAEAVTAAGSTVAIGVTAPLTNITSTGATVSGNALTLADGVQGQMKIITLIVDGGDVQINPANFANGLSITMEDAGDNITLIFNNSKWQILSNTGCTIGT